MDGGNDGNSDLKQRRRRQQERQKTIALISKALAVHVRYKRWYIPTVVLCKTTLWNDHIQGFMENVNAW